MVKQGLLSAHMARANPQWRSFSSDTEVTVIFHGPHAYVSPRWYAPQPDDVPTWNYAVVHVHGTSRIIQDEDAGFLLMQRLVRHHDPEWTLSLSEQGRRDLLREIVIFEIDVTKVEAKFKLSQNRSAIDFAKVAEQPGLRKSDLERGTGEMLENFFPRRRATLWKIRANCIGWLKMIQTV